jgi:hypothetical protein
MPEGHHRPPVLFAHFLRGPVFFADVSVQAQTLKHFAFNRTHLTLPEVKYFRQR